MEISDPRAIRALAHPLRLDLLKRLGAQGPATAAQCGRALGASQASCSFHLRQLAKYGLVEDAGPASDRRERLWRLPDPRLTVRLADGTDAVVRRRVERLTVEQEMQAILDYSERHDGASPQWRHKAGVLTGMLALSPEDAAEIKEKWFALLAPYRDRAYAAGPDLQPGQSLVRCFLALTPLTSQAATDKELTDDDLLRDRCARRRLPRRLVDPRRAVQAALHRPAHSGAPVRRAHHHLAAEQSDPP